MVAGMGAGPENSNVKKKARGDLGRRDWILLGLWTAASLGGCRATLQRSKAAGGGRSQGGTRADDLANGKTHWQRVLIFVGWAGGTWLYARLRKLTE
jgi:hypothetical protein